ncbi:uroporphyrinogen-III synthase [Flavobacterium wongokense]|uniref:uroporphyrinogen-III synthase n=1 Tax=Flavobacterium wongokense TaxID=2910674 RepID=UPI001F2F8560|nr:uroporphyrinogen-III synthase [Flavobacterium sp. WG47]MCF6131538.1 uroporphyrinogen-III synthase [Flavobacterium sp. WG47]
MQNPIRILSTKKLSEKQKQLLLNADFSVFDANFISIQSKDFKIDSINDCLIFTSQNAVESVLQNRKIREIKIRKCFCVGEKTKALLEQNGFEIIEYSDYAAELASIIFNKYPKISFTFFCGNIRRDVLPDALRLGNIKLDEIEVYTTNPATHKIDFTPDGILFFSPSAVGSFLQENKIEDEICFCIGNTTAEALKYATPNIIIANQPNVESTIMKCIEYYRQ